MNCGHCGGETFVVDKRTRPDGQSVRRRRECKACGQRMTTNEAQAEMNPQWRAQRTRALGPLRRDIERALGRALEWQPR